MSPLSWPFSPIPEPARLGGDGSLRRRSPEATCPPAAPRRAWRRTPSPRARLGRSGGRSALHPRRLTFDQLRDICGNARPVAFAGEALGSYLGKGRIFVGAGGMEPAIRAQFDDVLAVVDLGQEDVDRLTGGEPATRHFFEIGLAVEGFVHVLCDETNNALLEGLREAGLLPAGVDVRVV